MSHRFNSKRCDTSLYAPLPFLGSVPFTTLHSDGSTHCIHMKSAGNNFHPSQIPTVPPLTSVTMYNYHPRLLAKSNIEKQYFSHRVNDVCNGSPSRILRVRLISFGITILPRSSTRRTMPVAFIVSSPLKRVKARFLPVAVFAGKGELCMGRWKRGRGH